MTPPLEKEGPVASNSSNPAPEVSKDKPKGHQKKQRGPKNNQGKGKCKAHWHRPYPQGYRIPKLEPSVVESVFNTEITPMAFKANNQERIREEYHKHDSLWWKSEIITKWDNNSWRFKIKNASESAILNSEKDLTLTWFLKNKMDYLLYMQICLTP
ncbi:hypothetical protein O181_016625 [Austropuccinia psidii MF-1]|uniref:Uncharacterized protein n=1 Tax=Austropuccinia psidii MF-1 TaxID=1389203 RepID=A0A9Q3C684_9BASI|nr:hypothetical protein [Austropuccinia psidii MF-1]